ncbi:MAG: hypothetical protein WAW85_02305 [Gordonia sp. (in: high G+C Gram-positive bacteria)]|uniref:hypothetical protein n=1 Tax=Gordonia sp. (in: high G+C Gram-positive bacteria) TaxID=84139 RepID=UPI003BB61A40
MRTVAEPPPAGAVPSILDGAALSHAASSCGGLVVTTTADGLPVGVRISQAQLSVSLDVVAERIVALCALAAASSAHQRRLSLAAAGTAREVLDALGLPDRSGLLRAEAAVDRWCGTGARR